MRRVVVLGLLLAALLGLAVVADRVALARAESLAQRQVRQEVRVEGDLEVQLHGFPFLTQLARGRLDQVTGTADEVTFGTLTLIDVGVVATGVPIRAPVSADTADLRATIPTATLGQVVRERTELELSVAVEAGAIVVSGDALGVTWAATATPRVEAGRLLVELGEVRIGDAQVEIERLPGALRDRLLALEVPVDELPDGLVLTGAAVVADGVRVTASGTDLVWAPPGG